MGTLYVNFMHQNLYLNLLKMSDFLSKFAIG